MKKLLGVVALLFCAQTSYALLPPQYQNAKDLDVMVAFVKAHAYVSATLRSIDLERGTIYYGESCSAVFVREKAEKPQGWVGPAAPLVFRQATCKIDY